MRVALSSLCLLLAAACGDDLRPAGGAADAGAPSPDAGDDTIPIEREQAGGSPGAVVLAGDLAYVVVGPRLTIWRGGALVGESEPFTGMVTDVVVAGDRAFVGEHSDLAGRLHVLDVSDPARPVETASLRLVEEGATIPLGMAVVGDRLFVADQERGIAVVDIADRDAPSVSRTVPHAGVTDVVVAGDRLYYLATSFLGGGVGALDLADDLGELGETSLFDVAGVTVTASDLVVAAGVGGIRVVDVSNLDDPIERYSYSLEGGGPFARAVAATASAAWIPAEDGMYVLDLSDPTDISRAGPFDLELAGASASDTAGGVLAVTSDRGELGLFDVSEAEPTRSARVDVSLCADCIGVAVNGERLAIGDAAGGLKTAVVADLALVGRSPEPGEMVDFEDVALAGDLAYAADWFFGLRIYDLSDPAAPAPIGAVDTAGYPSSVALAGSRAYVGESTNGGFLRIVDVSVPAEAIEIGATTTSAARDVEVRDGLAFVADASLDLPGGLRIFDVSDPGNIQLVGTYGSDCSEALDVALTGDLAVVACSYGGFHVVDIADPAHPARRAVVPAPELSSAWSVAAWDGGAALGHDFGVIVVDLADPTAPAMVAEHATAFTARALTAPGDGRLLAGCGLAGVYQWPL